MRHMGVKVLCCLVLFLFNINYAQEYIVMGGGYHPLHSEVSIEKDVIKMVAAIGAKPKTVFYGSGNNTNICDVSEKYRDLDLILSYVLGFEEHQITLYECKMRHNKIPSVNYPATSEFLYQSLDNIRLSETKRPLKIYYAGHGVEGSIYDEEDLTEFSDDQKSRLNFDANMLSLWEGADITVQEFTEKLDGFEKNHQIQLLMVQCYSGGFSQINYVKGDIWEYELSEHNRCGFFSQLPSRVAAGCTSDLTQNRGYSRYFHEAFISKKADFDSNGMVSTPEAHAYVTINSQSIDIPITTSSQLMHDYKLLSKKATISPEIKNTSLEILLEKMSFIEKQTFYGLVERLNIENRQLRNTPYLFIDQSVKTLEAEYQQLEDKLQPLADNLNTSIVNAQRVVFEQYPYVFMRFLPNNDQVREQQNQYNNDMEALAERIRNDEEFLEDIKTSSLAYNNAMNLIEQKEREIVVWERLQYLIETVMIREYLVSTDSELLVKYKKLLECENSPFLN